MHYFSNLFGKELYVFRTDLLSYHHTQQAKHTYQYKNTKEKLCKTYAAISYNKICGEKQLNKNWTNDYTSNLTHI
jgi:hypothetical protein